MEYPITREGLAALDKTGPRYELIANAFVDAIKLGRLRSGERLPTVRQLARDFGVSGTTITSAYTLLSEKGLISSEVGRGTFVKDSLPQSSRNSAAGRVFPTPSPGGRNSRPNVVAWRRRLLISSAARLRDAYPTAVDCTTGRPDPTLLPWKVLNRAWLAAVQQTNIHDLQYAGPEPIEELVRELVPRLAIDGVPTEENDLVVGSSAQQLMVLCLEIVAALAHEKEIVIAVEEPGYPTILDTFERAGYRLVGVEVDAEGAVPASLQHALSKGANTVLFTPRAHNPTGASWSRERSAALADVIAAHREVLVIEDDQFAGIAKACPGSLIADRRIEDQVVYIRSFSKSIAPDLRLAIAVARPRLRTLLAEAKTYADGWSSRLAQRALAYALSDPEMDQALFAACTEYAERRAGAAGGLHEYLSSVGGGSWRGTDGVNIWVRLPSGVDSLHVMESAAALGVLVAPGEPFFIRPGRSDVVRLNAGAVTAENATELGRLLAKAFAKASIAAPSAIPV